MSRDNGGSAFPHEDIVEWSGSNSSPGMFLRDWFAGVALQGLISAVTTSTLLTMPTNEELDSYRTKRAYEIADAMLRAREGNL